MPKIERPGTLTSEVVAYIRDAVIRGEFEPERPLPEVRLAQELETARWIPELRRICSPYLRGSRPESPVAAAWSRIAATQTLIAVMPSAAMSVKAWWPTQTPGAKQA